MTFRSVCSDRRQENDNYTYLFVFQQLNDSSVIISALTTFMSTEEKDLQKIISFFPKIDSQDKKASTEFGNKYEIMTGTPGRSESEKYVCYNIYVFYAE